MSIDFEVTMNEYLPLRDVVFNTLRRAILRGELKPGERLMEIQLANKLGVSRTPIREAIRKLELEGLVLMIPRKGAEVAEISEKNLKNWQFSLRANGSTKQNFRICMLRQNISARYWTATISRRSARRMKHFMM